MHENTVGTICLNINSCKGNICKFCIHWKFSRLFYDSKLYTKTNKWRNMCSFYQCWTYQKADGALPEGLKESTVLTVAQCNSMLTNLSKTDVDFGVSEYNTYIYWRCCSDLSPERYWNSSLVQIWKGIKNFPQPGWLPATSLHSPFFGTINLVW